MREALTIPRVSHRLGTGLEVVFGPLELSAGERLVLFGPNGSGKTTTVRLLAGTLGPGIGRPVAYLPQRPFIFRGTTRHNLSLGLQEHEIGRAADLAGELGIGDTLDEPAVNLSGGERQRLGLARALARPEGLVLLDEPLAAIDVRNKDMVMGVIAGALDGRPAVIVTHDREVVAALADRVAVMVGGEVRQVGTIDQVFSLPVDDEVALAVGLGNVLSGVVADVDGALVAVEVDGIRIWALGDQPVGSHVKALFGAETVTVQLSEGPPSSARNIWTGSVTRVRPVGLLVELIVDVGPLVAVLITPGSLEALDLQPGSRVALSLKAAAARAVMEHGG